MEDVMPNKKKKTNPKQVSQQSSKPVVSSKLPEPMRVEHPLEDRKAGSEAQNMLYMQQNMLSKFAQHFECTSYVAPIGKREMFEDAGVKGLKETLLQQRAMIAEYSNDAFQTDAKLFFEGRQGSLDHIKEQLCDITLQVYSTLAAHEKLWQDNTEAEFRQLLQSTPGSPKALEEYNEVLKNFRKTKFEVPLANMAKKLKLWPATINSFKKIVLDLLEEKMRSVSMGCAFHMLEVSAQTEVTLKFCQEHYSKFLPLLIRQRERAKVDKVWVYGHKPKRQLKLYLINERGFNTLNSQRKNVLLKHLSLSPILVSNRIPGPVLSTAGRSLSSTTSNIFLVINSENSIKKLQLKAEYYTHLFFPETLTELANEKLSPLMLRDIASSYGSEEFLETIEALTPLTPELYQSFFFSKDKEPNLLPQEDFLAEIYADIGNKSAHVMDMPEDFYEEIISDLAKKLPVIKQLEEENFLALIKKLQETMQRLKLEWQQKVLLEKPLQPDQKELLEIMKEFEGFIAVIQNLQHSISVPKEIDGKNFLKLLKEIQAITHTVAAQISSVLESIEQEKKAVPGNNSKYKRLLELEQKSKELSVVREKVKNLELRLKILSEKYNKIEQEGVSPYQQIAQLEEQVSFLEKFKKCYFEMSEKIKAIEKQLQHPKEAVLSSEEVENMGALFVSQAEFIKTALCARENNDEYIDFFTKSLANLVYFAVRTTKMHSILIKEQVQKTICEIQKACDDFKNSMKKTATQTDGANVLMLQENNIKIVEYIKRALQAIDFFNDILIRKMQDLGCNIVLASEFKKTISMHEKKLIAVLKTVFNAFRYTSRIDIPEQDMIIQLHAWQLAKKRNKSPHDIDSHYLGSMTALELINKQLSCVRHIAWLHSKRVSDALQLIECNNKKLEIPNVKSEEFFNKEITQRLQQASKKFESLEQVIKQILTNPVNIVYPIKMQMAFEMGQLIRFVFAKLQFEIHKLACLDQEIERVVNQQTYHANLTDTFVAAGYVENCHLLTEEQQRLSTELQDLKQKRKSLLEGEVIQGRLTPSVLATLGFELKSGIDRMIDKASVDVHYDHLQKIMTKKNKTTMAVELVFMDDATKRSFEVHVIALKEALVPMCKKVRCAIEFLQKTKFYAAYDDIFNPEKYLEALSIYIERLEIMIKSFEVYKLVVDSTRFVKKVPEQTVTNRNPLEMALWSHQKAETQFLVAHQRALQARRFSHTMTELWDAGQRDVVAMVESQFQAHQTAMVTRIEQEFCKKKEQDTGPCAAVLEAEENDCILFGYQSLLEQHDKRDVASLTRKEAFSREISKLRNQRKKD